MIILKHKTVKVTDEIVNNTLKKYNKDSDAKLSFDEFIEFTEFLFKELMAAEEADEDDDEYC